MKKALDTEGQIISPERSNDFQKLFSESNDSKMSTFYQVTLAGTIEIYK